MRAAQVGCWVFFAVLVVVVGVAVEKEWYSSRHRDRLLGEAVARMTQDGSPGAALRVCRDLLELHDTAVVWRASAVAALLLAVVAGLLAAFCGSGWPVFLGVFFASLCVFYLKSGHQRTHVDGPMFAALRLASRAAAGDDVSQALPRQL